MTTSNTQARHPVRRLARLAVFAAASLAIGANTASAATAHDEASAPDPFEKVNRVLFYANGALDFLLIRPAAMLYRRVTPRPIRTGLHNAFANMGEPVVMMNDVFQGHGKKAVRTFGRFAENSTLGVAGLFDPATGSGLKHHDNDFGITLAHYGVKSGPYIFIPLLGPATVRDGFGLLGNWGLNPFTYVRFPYSDAVSIGRGVEEGLYQRAAADKAIQAITAAATDDYASIRSYYLQNREADISGRRADVGALPDFGEPAGAPPSSSSPSSPPAAAPLAAPEGPPAADAPTTDAPAMDAPTAPTPPADAPATPQPSPA